MRRRLEASPLTLVVGIVSLAVSLPLIVPKGGALVPSFLELRGGDAVCAQAWRLVTGHLVHLSLLQLVLNLAVFVWLGVLSEPMMPRRYGILLLGSSLAVSAGVLVLHPALGSYRGLSGIASAQFAALVSMRTRSAMHPGGGAPRLAGTPGGGATWGVPILCLALFLAKSAYELVTGHGVFTGSLGLGDASSSPAAHLSGALAGIAVTVLPRCSPSRVG